MSDFKLKDGVRVAFTGGGIEVRDIHSDLCLLRATFQYNWRSLSPAQRAALLWAIADMAREIAADDELTPAGV